MNEKIIFMLLVCCAMQVPYLCTSENLLLQIPGGYKPLTACGFFGNSSIAMPTDDNVLAIYDLQGNLQKNISGHQSVISAYDQSASGLHCATGSYDKTLYQYDGVTGQMHFNHRDHNDTVSLVRFSGDQKTLAALSWDNIIMGQATSNGDQIYYFKNNEPVITCAPNHDGNIIAISIKNSAAVELWLMKNDSHHEKRLRLVGHQKDIYAIDWSPDNLSIATGSADSTVKIWNSETGDTITTLGGFRGTRTPLRYSPDGRLLAVGSKLDDQIVVYDMSTTRPVIELAGHAGGTDALAWSPDGAKLVSCSDTEKTVKVWAINQQIVNQSVSRYARLNQLLKKFRQLASSCLSSTE